ncbi:hypothetical protein TUMEXPCC7403_22685 [Tumidithrix helvetica PCC 7403]|uniref:hypothetical protein n=1 Tax=Tumidithrix helvetica TaxID=3457545 RepID=UPI003C9A9A20
MSIGKRFREVVAVCVASVAIAVSGFCESSKANESLQSNLRQGGYVIYFRHGLASNDARPDDKLPTQIKDCKGERHITESGIKVIKTIKSQFNALKIPVGKAISSPACNAMETSWYLLGTLVTVAPTLDGNPREQIWTELRPFLVSAPAKGTNTVIFAHGTNIKALTGLVLAEGEAVIYQPDGKGGYTFVTRLKPEDWSSK